MHVPCGLTLSPDGSTARAEDNPGLPIFWRHEPLPDGPHRERYVLVYVLMASATRPGWIEAFRATLTRDQYVLAIKGDTDILHAVADRGQRLREPDARSLIPRLSERGVYAARAYP